MAAGSWALARSPVGLSGETYVFYTEDCDGAAPPSGACQIGETAFIPPGTTGASADDKFCIVHEMGHLLQRKKHPAGALRDDGAVPGDCFTDMDGDEVYTTSGDRPNDSVQREWQSTAAIEGFASYWAAFVFNRTDQADCGYMYYLPIDGDFDRNNEDPTIFSCETGPDSSFGVDCCDFCGDFCSPSSNQGVSFDWLRFLWNLTTDESVGATTIFNIWDDADPDSWDESGACSKSADCPTMRLQAAATANGVGTEWDALDHVHGGSR